MTQYTAKKTGFVMHDKHMDTVEYEYRGCTYEVRYAKDWTISITSPRIQHRDAQARIDEMIDNPAPERRCTEDAQVGFDKLWEYIQTGVWEE